ncbi:VOC family protein [Mobilicoccus caccae]|uniref:Lactoylglutathione lyase n=1 Tax=Mobilicoccus caccae TaxID=1859295 RepID=A0ABQ6IUI7_9MICO|nr:VOC family protein [Mobilicoccus caccae]GMA40353.1 lactoylglutathione lyase [Mobilicoccus caccae]
MTRTETTTTTTTRPVGSPTWIDLSTNDIDGAKAFYAALFGWSFEDQGEDFGHYHYIRRGEDVVGGLMSTVGMTCPEGGDLPNEWGVYLTVTDVEATLATAESAGGRVIVPAMPVGTSGTMAVVLDPAGAAIGMWQPGDFVGCDHFMTAGTPAWFEAMSQDYAAALPFYREVFAWQVEEMPGEWSYATNGPEATATAGLCDARGVVAEGTPSYWRVYLGTADLDADLARIPELGGTVLDGPEDSPTAGSPRWPTRRVRPSS